MPRMKGMVLTERDHALLGYLGVARYVTAAQAHRLIASGRDKAITSRRLARLCERGPNPGDSAFLRRLEYRRMHGLTFQGSERSRPTVLESPRRERPVQLRRTTVTSASGSWSASWR